MWKEEGKIEKFSPRYAKSLLMHEVVRERERREVIHVDNKLYKTLSYESLSLKSFTIHEEETKFQLSLTLPPRLSFISK